MLVALSEVSEGREGAMKFTRNGHTLTVEPPRRKDFSDVQALMQIRHFLSESDAPAAPQAPAGVHMLVVLDHREARIFKTELHGSIPQRIRPLDAQGAHRHLHHVDNDSNGQRQPEPKAYYEAVAQSLAGAQSILILGSSKGASKRDGSFDGGTEKASSGSGARRVAGIGGRQRTAHER